VTDDQQSGADGGEAADAGAATAVPNEEAARHPEASVEAPDPTRDLPSPAVEVPDPTEVGPDGDDGEATVDVPPDLWRSFWYLVVVFIAALLAFGAGLLLVTLGDDPDLGGRLLFVGAVLGVYGYYRYRQHPYRAGADADASG